MISQPLGRRRFLAAAAAATLAFPRSRAVAAAGDARFTLGFSLYGMKSLPLADSLCVCADLGYDDVEPALLPEYPTEPQQFGSAQRREMRALLESTGLTVPAVMDNLPAVTTDEKQRENLEKIARAAQLAHDLSPDRPPLLETVLGGKPDEWPKLREQMVESLGQWAEAAEKHDLTLAVKPHASNALHLPDDAVWLIEQVGSSRLKLVYDYSHFQAQGLELEPTLRKLLPYTVFIHVKDGERRDGKVRFLLPGEGKTDYAEYFRLLSKLGYNGSVTVEVSGQLHKEPGYDPRAVAKSCYYSLAAAWNEAGLPPRNSHS